MCSSVRCDGSCLEEVMVLNKEQNWSSDDCYMQERQLVLSLCLDKLQGSGVPSLHRSVLLANTLRHIQREITQENTNIPVAYSHMATPLCKPEHQFHPRFSLSTPSDNGQEDLDLSCFKCPEEVEMEIDVSFFPSLFATFSSSTPVTDTAFTDNGLLSLTSLFEAGNPQANMTDFALDDIFEDIDTSMYDSSEASSIMACVFCSVSHLFGGNEAAKVFSDCPSVSPMQCSSAELNDLDQIMEVLVGMA